MDCPRCNFLMEKWRGYWLCHGCKHVVKVDWYKP